MTAGPEGPSKRAHPSPIRGRPRLGGHRMAPELGRSLVARIRDSHATGCWHARAQLPAATSCRSRRAAHQAPGRAWWLVTFGHRGGAGNPDRPGRTQLVNARRCACQFEPFPVSACPVRACPVRLSISGLSISGPATLTRRGRSPRAARHRCPARLRISGFCLAGPLLTIVLPAAPRACRPRQNSYTGGSSARMLDGRRKGCTPPPAEDSTCPCPLRCA